MKTIKLTISAENASKYGLDNISDIALDELVDRINMDFAREALLKAQLAAQETGLSELTPEEIEAEIKAVRNENHS